jgi:hypothetical protein
MSLPACQSSAPQATKEGAATAAPVPEKPAADAPRAVVTKLGSPITETAVTPLAQIVAEPSRFTDKTVRTEGTVTSVCQAKGCWMQLSDTTGAAHVKFAGYSFFVPKTARGKRAVVQGKIVPSVDECASKDGCREAGEKASGQVAKVDFEATGVELVD